jgi:hypothetical protein
LKELGELLGFEAERPSGNAPPDGAWRDGQQVWLLFEAKTEERPENAVSVSEARQAASHHDWVRAQLGWDRPERSLTALVSYKTSVDASAAAVGRDVVLVGPGAIRELGSRAIALHREIRPRARGLSDEQLAAAIAEEFRSRRLRSEDLVAALDQRRVADG